MARTSQTRKAYEAGNVVAGLRKRLAPRRKHRIGGKDYTTAEIIAVFQEQVDAFEAIRTARAQLAAAVANERRVAGIVRDVIPALKSFVGMFFGRDNASVLAEFGWSPPKKTGPKTVAAKAEGALKAKATREARHTMGKRQRLAIRG